MADLWPLWLKISVNLPVIVKQVCLLSTLIVPFIRSSPELHTPLGNNSIFVSPPSAHSQLHVSNSCSSRAKAPQALWSLRDQRVIFQNERLMFLTQEEWRLIWSGWKWSASNKEINIGFARHTANLSEKQSDRNNKEVYLYGFLRGSCWSTLRGHVSVWVKPSKTCWVLSPNPTNWAWKSPQSCKNAPRFWPKLV